MFDCLSIKKEYDQLQATLDQFCPVYQDKDASVKGQCTSLASGLTRKRIELAVKEGKFKEAAGLYIKMTQDFPNDPKIDEVYYSAAVLFERAHLLGSAIGAREALLKVRPRLGAGEEGHLPDRS